MQAAQSDMGKLGSGLDWQVPEREKTLPNNRRKLGNGGHTKRHRGTGGSFGLSEGWRTDGVNVQSSTPDYNLIL